MIVVGGVIEVAAALWWNWVAPVSVQATLVALVVVLVDLACGRTRWPAFRAAAWWLVLLRFALPPWLASPVGILPGTARWVAEPAVVEAEGMPTDLAILLFVTWLGGVTILATVAVRRHLRMRRAWLHEAHPVLEVDAIASQAAARMGLRRAPTVLVGSRVEGAAVLGALRPVILLPSSLVAALPRRRLEHVLMHECAHLVRRDPLWSTLALVLHLLFWFHPVAWLARRRIAALRELSCDRRVALVLAEQASEYRRTLLELARPLAEVGRRTPELAFVFGGSLLMARLALLDAVQRPASWNRLPATALLVAVLAACCVLPGPPPRAPLPTWDQTEGCLQKRFLLYDRLASQTAVAPDSDAEVDPPAQSAPTKRIPPSLRSMP